jgi:hypothetical protein
MSKNKNGVHDSVTLGVGYVSNLKELGSYYQDFTSALVHIEEGVFAILDEKGIPYMPKGDKRYYSIVLIIQYGLMHIDFFHSKNEKKYLEVTEKCMNWLEENKVVFKDTVVWRSEYNQQYNLPNGWVSGMYQGQAISLYLRYYQLTGDKKYLDTAEIVYKSFKYTYEEGGFKRYDKLGCIWYEEYTTEKPSFVLNGFIYAMLGLYDLYRVTGRQDVKEDWDNCVNTLLKNLQKYDVWYWSVYDQLKEQLVSYYYQKNVHIPLMQIMYGITKDETFNSYAIKWQRNLDNPVHQLITKIMYRIQPRIKKILNK